MFCIVIDPEAASFPTNPNALCPNCSYNKDPKIGRTQKHEGTNEENPDRRNCFRSIKSATIPPSLAVFRRR